MASEYWNWKFRDVKPEEKRELTPEEKRKNWWYYHKWHIAIGLILAGIAVNLVWNALHKVEPDYQIAYVGTYQLPDSTAAALEEALAEFGEDLNGDGKVWVRLAQYTTDAGNGDPQVAIASEVRLMADITEGESYIFLLEDPEQFQLGYRSLCHLDGSLPEDGDYSAEGTYLAWDSCPVLTRLDLGEYSYNTANTANGTATGSGNELLSGLYVARRGFWTEKDAAHLDGWTAMWDKLTEGAAA